MSGKHGKERASNWNSSVVGAIVGFFTALSVFCLVGVSYGISKGMIPDPFPPAAEESAPTQAPKTHVIEQGTMSDSEAQALVDARATSSRMLISLAPDMKLDDGRLRVNLIVPEDNNGIAERVEIVQDGEIVFASESVLPGSSLEWADAPDAHEGAALAMVHAVNDKGSDFGSAVCVEVSIEKAESVSRSSAESSSTSTSAASEDD